MPCLLAAREGLQGEIGRARGPTRHIDFSLTPNTVFPPAQINIAMPAQGTMKVIDCDDEKKLVHFFDKKMAAEVDGSALGEEFSGYVFR